MKNMYKFIIPLWINMAVNTLTTITNFFFLNKSDLRYAGACGIATIPITFVSTIFIGVGIAANRRIAQDYPFPFKTMYRINAIFSLIVAILCYIFSSYILLLFSENSLYPIILQYFQIYIFDIVPVSIMVICTGILRGMGKPQKTIIFSTFNVILNFLVITFLIQQKKIESIVFLVGFSTVISDIVTTLLYILYINQLKYEKLDNTYKSRNLKKEILKESYSFSIDKLLSISSLTILSKLFLIQVPALSLSFYYNLESLFEPIKMLPYCYFDWILYSQSKKILSNKKKATKIYSSLITIMGVISIFYLNISTLNQIIIIFIFIFYSFLQLVDRSVTAVLFTWNKAMIANKIQFFKMIFLISVLSVLSILNFISIFSVLLIQLIFLSIQILLYKRIISNSCSVE